MRSSILGVESLEDTLSITKRRNVTSSVLFVHGLSGQDFGNHVSENSHHGGTSVVDLNIELADLLLWVKVGTEISNSVVSVVLGGRHPCELNKGEEKNDLGKSSGRNGTNSIATGWDIRELEVGRRGKVSIKDNVVVVHDGSNNGSHGNTSVLALDGTTTLEGLWFSVQPSKRIEDSERLSGTELELVDVEAS